MNEETNAAGVIREINEEYSVPEWDHPSSRGDWRAFVGERTRAIWHTLNDDQKEAIALDAEDEALEAAGRSPW